MKKLFLLAALIAGSLANASIIVRDVADFVFTEDSSYAIDFNNDGTPEFTFRESWGSIACIYSYGEVDFVVSGTFDSGYGWDKLKSLPFNSVIGPQSNFATEGDAYLNADWAEPQDIFPAGDSYIGVKFKLGNNFHYGWILVNSTGGANGVITLKSFAYNDVANQSLNAGQTTLSLSDLNINSIKIYPNPTQDVAFIETEYTVKSAFLTNVKGEALKIKMINNSLDLTSLSAGIYFVTIETTTNQKSTFKLIKL